MESPQHAWQRDEKALMGLPALGIAVGARCVADYAHESARTLPGSGIHHVLGPVRRKGGAPPTADESLA
jgi:hypothetical protein